jgi:hypothetical protein
MRHRRSQLSDSSSIKSALAVGPKIVAKHSQPAGASWLSACSSTTVALALGRQASYRFIL